MSYNRWISSSYDLELYHHGIKGQKWGVRRYQDKWGHLTNAGRRRINRLNDKGDVAYAKGNAKKAGKLYAKAGLVGGESVDELQARYRRTASGFRKTEAEYRTDHDRKASEYYGLSKAQREKRRDDFYKQLQEDLDTAFAYAADADRYERRYKALIAKYGDLEPDTIRKRHTAIEEQQTRKQIDYLASRPFERKRLKRQLKEALEYENQPQNKADKERMKGQVDEDGYPALLDWPELTRSDDIKRQLKHLKTGF